MSAEKQKQLEVEIDVDAHTVLLTELAKKTPALFQKEKALADLADICGVELNAKRKKFFETNVAVISLAIRETLQEAVGALGDDFMQKTNFFFSSAEQPQVYLDYLLFMLFQEKYRCKDDDEKAACASLITYYDDLRKQCEDLLVAKERAAMIASILGENPDSTSEAPTEMISPLAL